MGANAVDVHKRTYSDWPCRGVSGRLVLAKADGILFIPAILAEQAVSAAEFTNLKDAFNFELNRNGKNGAMFEGGWNAAKYEAFGKWVNSHPEMLKMQRPEFDAMLTQATQPRRGHNESGSVEP